MDAERAHLQRMIEILSDNLHTLEEQAAVFGPLHVPLFLKRQIEETREELGRTKEQLANLETPSYPDQQHAASLPQSQPPGVNRVGRAAGETKVLISDVVDNNIGIERIWPDRRAWQFDTLDGLEKWHNRVCQARRIDIVSNTLWHNWMYQDQFRAGLFDNIAHGAYVRILIYEPDSEVSRLRAEDENDVPGEMKQEIKCTLFRVAEGRNGLPKSARRNLEVGLTNRALHPAQIIRADERMVVAIYLSGKSGSPSPTMQLGDSDSCYFRKYAEQFEILWQWKVPLDDDRFSQILQEYGRLLTPHV